jgi:hypothetical protein
MIRVSRRIQDEVFYQYNISMPEGQKIKMLDWHQDCAGSGPKFSLSLLILLVFLFWI